MDRLTTRNFLTIFTCLVILASVTEARYCFRRYVAARNKCRVAIQGDFTDGEDCCTNGNGGGWSRKRKGGQCTSCEEILANIEPQEDPWNPWSDWGECSKTCESGFKYRHRTCKDGRQCEGQNQQVIPCVLQQNCPVDGGWSDWEDWGQCSVSCEEGRQYRNRLCNNPPPLHGGAECVGDSREIRPCNPGPCPIDGQWGPWSDYTECSATCGNEATKRRLRLCDNPAPQYGGNDCVGPKQQIRICELNPCPVDGRWNEWGDWTPCSATCGKGRILRRRTCESPKYGGRECQGTDKQSKRCNGPVRCPVHGGWSEWSEWGRCSAPACTGKRGHQTRSHSCTNPAPRNGGRYCSGNIIDVRTCVNNEGCPVHGNWGDWQAWGPCSQTCGSKSFQQRMRECDNPAPQNGGRYCQGQAFNIRDCRGLPSCPGGEGGQGGDDGEYSGSGDSGSGDFDDGMGDDEDYGASGSGLE